MVNSKGDEMKGIKPEYMRWAKDKLPNEYQPFVAIAYEMMKRNGLTTTPETVRQRLASCGRDRNAIIERHRKYGSTKRTPQQDQQMGKVEAVATRQQGS